MKQVFILGILFFMNTAWAQEMNCQVQVNAVQTGQTNLTVFKTLEKSLTEFVNQTNWTNVKFKDHEKINCSLFITVTSYDAGSFSGTLQIQSSRPVYGASMTTPILNFKDEQFSFEYVEYEPLNYNPNSFDSNLVAVVSYYVYTILGMDADTFSPLGGSSYFQEANNIVNMAQQSDYAGWSASDGDQSRYQFNKDVLAPNFEPFRKALYVYHREGLDEMHKNVEQGKKTVAKAIQQLGKIPSIQSNSIVLRAFFDAKANEIEKIFSDGPSIDITEVAETLSDLAPQHNDKWRNISY